jgi:hypothetical protein
LHASGIIRAGLSYGLIVFALGFVLGTLRELVLAPRFGRDHIVWIEVPLILLAAWFVAGWLVRRMVNPPGALHCLAVGAIAFSVLMLGELLVAVFGFGRSIGMHLATYWTAQGALELLPQIGFGLIPLFHRVRRPAS